MDRASLEQLLGRGLSLAEIGRLFDRHESTVAYWVGKYGLEAVRRDKHGAKGGLTAEQLAPLVEHGMSIAAIAEAVGRSKGTVRYWLSRAGLTTRGAAGRRMREQARAAKLAGHATLVLFCARHGESEFCLEGRGYYRCKRCRSEAVTRRRRKVKSILVAEAGGACESCGYDECPAALEFHHLVPAEKSFELSRRGVTRSIASARAEASKCVLLCANCHAAVGVGAITLERRDAAHVQCLTSTDPSPG
jgi:transposase